MTRAKPSTHPLSSTSITCLLPNSNQRPFQILPTQSSSSLSKFGVESEHLLAHLLMDYDHHWCLPSEGLKTPATHNDATVGCSPRAPAHEMTGCVGGCWAKLSNPQPSGLPTISHNKKDMTSSCCHRAKDGQRVPYRRCKQ